jgi:flagellar hook-basal body complex protein FliE
MAITGVSGLNTILSNPTRLDNIQSKGNSSDSFANYFNDALNKVNDMQLQSEQMTNDLAAGKTNNIDQVMIAADKADIALQFTMQVRNKIMDAYNEIMRMQI